MLSHSVIYTSILLTQKNADFWCNLHRFSEECECSYLNAKNTILNGIFLRWFDIYLYSEYALWLYIQPSKFKIFHHSVPESIRRYYQARLSRVFLSVCYSIYRGRSKQKGTKIKWGRPKLKGKKIKWERRERKGGQGRKRVRCLDWENSKIKKKGEEKVIEGSFDILT